MGWRGRRGRELIGSRGEGIRGEREAKRGWMVRRLYER